MKKLLFLYCIENIPLLKSLKDLTINGLSDRSTWKVGAINAFKTAEVSELFVITEAEKKCVDRVFACTDVYFVNVKDAKMVLFAVGRFLRSLSRKQLEMPLESSDKKIREDLIDTFEAFDLWKHFS